MTTTADTPGTSEDPTNPPITVPDGIAEPLRTMAPGGSEVLASDPEREHVTERLRAAAAEGRLTLTESDERQAAAYAARTRAELIPLVSDLPETHRPRRARRGELTPRARRNLGVHAGIVAVLLVFMVIGGAVGFVPFVPVGPILLLLLTVFIHRRRAERGPSPDETIPPELR